MASAVKLRTDFSAKELRRLAAGTKNANESRRLLLLAAVLDGMNRTEAARIGGMDRQTLRDWVHRFNEHGPVATATRIDPDEVAVTPDAGEHLEIGLAVAAATLVVPEADGHRRK